MFSWPHGTCRASDRPPPPPLGRHRDRQGGPRRPLPVRRAVLAGDPRARPRRGSCATSAHRLDREPEGFELDLGPTARHLGLGRPTSAGTPPSTGPGAHRPLRAGPDGRPRRPRRPAPDPPAQPRPGRPPARRPSRAPTTTGRSSSWSATASRRPSAGPAAWPSACSRPATSPTRSSVSSTAGSTTRPWPPPPPPGPSTATATRPPPSRRPHRSSPSTPAERRDALCAALRATADC